MAHGAHETEIKLAVPDAETARRVLRTAGFRVAKRRVLEKNTVYDTSGCDMQNAASLLRVRQTDRAKLTYKGRPIASKHKSREELELEVSDSRTMGLILERLGFAPVFRYEKYRTELQQIGSRGVATVDETPIGVFLELEGSPGWIDRTARKLGFAEADYITKSYGRLYLEWCARGHVTPTHMVFT